MPAGDYLAGLVFLAGTWGLSAYVAAVIQRRTLPRLDPVPRAIALGLLFMAALIAAHLVPGALGILSPWTTTITAFLGAALASRLPRAAPTEPAPAPAADGGRISRILAGAAVVAVAAFTLAALSTVRHEPPTQVDALSFSMPGVAQWVHTGSIWSTGSFLPLIQVRTYPNNGDVLVLATVLPWHNDAFLRLLPVLLLGFTGLAIFGVARELRTPPATAALAACAALSTDVIGGSALYQLKPDVFMYGTFAAGVMFLLRSVRTRARSDLVLAGLGLGLAFGSRWYGLSAVGLVVAVWAVGLLLARRGLGVVARDALLLAGVVLAAGGFWFVRNLVITGNPLYPAHVDLLGLSVLHAPPDVITDKFGYTVIDRLGQQGFVIHQLIPGWRQALGLPGLLALLGSVLGALLVAARLRAGRAVPWRALGLLAATVLVSVSYAFIPASAQGTAAHANPGITAATVRWLAPGFVLAICTAAWGAGRLPPRWRLGAEAALLVGTLVALTNTFDVSAPRVLGVAAGLVVAGALARQLVGRPGWLRSRRPAVVGAVAAAALIVAGLGYEQEHSYNRVRYAGRSPVVDWVDVHARAGQRIGVAGFWRDTDFVPIYPLFGPRYRNRVEYVGPVVSGQVRLYHDAARFGQALRRKHYDLVVVGQLEAPDLNHIRPQRQLDTPPQLRWAESAGYREVTRGGDFILLRRST